MNRIVITGGAGYIGSMLVPELLHLGHEVTVVDNFRYRQASLLQYCRNPRFHVVNGDVRDVDLMPSIYSKADIIIPLAAFVGAPLCNQDPIGARTTNYNAVIDMLNHLDDEQWVLMPTTNSAYGSGDGGHHCNEESPLNPISRYALDKVEIERELMKRRNSISFRLATVFGLSPRMRMDLLVNDFVYRAVKDRFVIVFEGHFKRNYVHVSDVVNTFIHGIENFSTMYGNIYNVGLSTANVSKIELCQVIADRIPGFVYMEAPVGTDPDQRNYLVSNDKLESTGWRAKVTLESGIDELVKGYEMLNNRIYGNV